MRSPAPSLGLALLQGSCPLPGQGDAGQGHSFPLVFSLCRCQWCQNSPFQKLLLFLSFL